MELPTIATKSLNNIFTINTEEKKTEFKRCKNSYPAQMQIVKGLMILKYFGFTSGTGHINTNFSSVKDPILNHQIYKLVKIVLLKLYINSV